MISCPHTTLPNADADRCSQCIGPVLKALPRNGDVRFDKARHFRAPLAAAPITAAEHGATARKLASDRRAKATAASVARAVAPPNTTTIDEIAARLGTSRQSIHGSLKRHGIRAVGSISPNGRGREAGVYLLSQVERWIATRKPRARRAAKGGQS